MPTALLRARRRVLAVGVGVALTAAPLVATAAEVRADDGTDAVPIRVLTINDLHGRIETIPAAREAGAAVIAGAIAQSRAEQPGTLAVAAGDSIGASTFTSFIGADNPTIDALVAAGFDAGVVGNHEFDAGFADLVDRVIPRYGDARYALGANVYASGTSTPVLPEYSLHAVDGVRVAFIGTVTPHTATMVRPTGITDLRFGDQLEAANRVAAEVTAADLADVIVLLAHDGARTTDCAAIAAEASDFGELIRGAHPAIDAIVSGHTHLPYACVIEGRPVIQAHQYGSMLGQLDLRVDRRTGEVLEITGRLVPLIVDEAPAFAPDPAVAAIVADAVAIADIQGEVTVGRVSADILRGGDPPGADRGVESALGNLIADVFVWATTSEDYTGAPAVIGLMNAGGLRDDLRYGDDGVVTFRGVANVQPFANTLVTLTLTGAQLGAVLEEQWQPEGARREKRHLGVSAGFEYTADPTAPLGSRIIAMTLDGEPIDPVGRYVVVTHSFLADGGDELTTLAAATDRTDTGMSDLKAAIDYFRAHPVVDPAPLGRALTVDGSAAVATAVDGWAFGIAIASVILLVGGVIIIVLRLRLRLVTRGAGSAGRSARSDS